MNGFLFLKIMAWKTKGRGDAEERRLAVKLSKATGFCFERQVLSGADRRHKGDIVCNDHVSHLIEVKYRKALVEKSVSRGHSQINHFIKQLPSDKTSLLIVVTGGGVHWRKKGMKKDWLFAKKNQVNRCAAFDGHHWWLGESCHFPFHTYRTKPDWVFARLDEVLKIKGCEELFGL